MSDVISHGLYETGGSSKIRSKEENHTRAVAAAAVMFALTLAGAALFAPGESDERVVVDNGCEQTSEAVFAMQQASTSQSSEPIFTCE